MSEENEIQVWKPQQAFAGTDLVPAMQAEVLVSDEDTGAENVEAEDLVIPRLALLQGQSEAVTGQVEGAQPGKFYLSTSGEVMKPPLRVLLVHHYKSRALFPKPKNPRTKDLKKCLSRDFLNGNTYGSCADCDHKEWGPNNEPPACAEAHNFVAMTPSGPAVLRFSITSVKAARNFLTTWTMSPPKKLFAHPVLIGVKSRMKDMGDGDQSTYFTMDMKWDQREDVPPAVQERLVAIREQVRQSYESGKLRDDQEDKDDIPF